MTKRKREEKGRRKRDRRKTEEKGQIYFSNQLRKRDGTSD